MARAGKANQYKIFDDINYFIIFTFFITQLSSVVVLLLLLPLPLLLLLLLTSLSLPFAVVAILAVAIVLFTMLHDDYEHHALYRIYFPPNGDGFDSGDRPLFSFAT